MTTSKKVASNRINGRKSRGPHTSTAKARSSRNARRPGSLHLTPMIPPYRARLSNWWTPSAKAMTIRSCASRRW